MTIMQVLERSDQVGQYLPTAFVELPAWKADVICGPPLQHLWLFPPLGGPLLATARSQWPQQEREMNFQRLSVTRRPYRPSSKN